MNLIIDGMNIAFRCSFIYDAKQGLSDSEGNPTGTVFGFLRHIIGLKSPNRWPHAKVWVAWEGIGSVTERRKVFADYKANREPKSEESPLFQQIPILMRALTDMGVSQVWEDGLEADDMIASLVRGILKDESNIIVSSDRDLLQLVGNKTVQMTPHPEKFYDAEAVEQHYGVPPERLLAYRVLDGDKSDNIPGMFRFPRKKIASLINEYGNVESLYENPPNGDLTPLQKKTLLEFRDQAKLNSDIMALRTTTTYHHETGELNTDKLALLCDQLGFRTLREDLIRFSKGFHKIGEADVGVLHSEHRPPSIIW